MPTSRSAHLSLLRRVILILVTATTFVIPLAAASAAGAAAVRVWSAAARGATRVSREGENGIDVHVDCRGRLKGRTPSSMAALRVRGGGGGGVGGGKGEEAAAQSHSCLGDCFGLGSRPESGLGAGDGDHKSMLTKGNRGRLLVGAGIAWVLANVCHAGGGRSEQGAGYGMEKREAQVQRTLLENALRARRFLAQDMEARSRGGVGRGRGRRWLRGREYEALVERDKEQMKSLSFLIAVGVVQEIVSSVGRAAYSLVAFFQRPRDEDAEALA